MAAIDLFLVGDKQRLVVKNFIDMLEELEFRVSVIQPEYYSINLIPKTAKHVILCLSVTMDFRVVRAVAEKVYKNDIHLYITGNINGLSPEEELYVKQIPGVHFPTVFPPDIEVLQKEIEYNERGKKRILVVDDEPVMLRSIQNWLQDEFEVSLLNSGELVYDYLDMHPIDLILLDYNMPGMDGPEVLKILRLNKDTENIPVMFLTAKNDRESVMTVMKLKPEGYILKTKNPEEIKGAVKDYFKNKIINV